jgi:hypothetical protein
MDQEIGGLLSLDPAECTHWKKGRKQIRSVDAAISIAAHLGCPNWIVASVMTGVIDAAEGFEEVKGFGPFDVDMDFVESVFLALRKDHPDQWTPARESLTRQHCRINPAAIKSVVQGIHASLGFSEPPFYLPELLRLRPAIDSGTDSDPFCDDSLDLKNPRPLARFLAARKLATRWLAGMVDPGRNNLPLPLQEHLGFVEANRFALELLAPVAMVRREIATADPSQDLIARLADIFWLSRSLMNLQLKAAIFETPSLAGVR